MRHRCASPLAGVIGAVLVTGVACASSAPDGADDTTLARPTPGAGIASMLFTLLVGYLVDHFSYTPVYVIVGFMGPLGAMLFLLIMKRIERVPPRPA